ncbi:MAG TPA: 4-hydroxythreonine-4-phosphate dehydrogenase PdxA [bacterium]|nr:4-hydroxythreonine-4-phosphate dehydrogenase PdxA [bacterium]HQL61730.1 4-hydroxythreonine-4-phosphate dehydrogenase PdxA [bacterium]
MTHSYSRNIGQSVSRLLITMGDPAGIGPEIICKALTGKELDRFSRYGVIGLVDALSSTAEKMGRRVRFRSVATPEEMFLPAGNEIPVLEPDGLEVGHWEPGIAQAVTGEIAFRCITTAIEVALAGQCDAVVTAPICKESLHKAGHGEYAGHTEIFTRLTGAKSTALMLISGKFRVAHVTNHVALRETCGMVKRQRVFDVIRLTNNALARIDGKPPRIAVASYNPHAGESGLFGREEIEEIEPAVQEAQRAGIQVSGPFPPDSLFPQMLGGRYEGIVAMYHDQGHIAFKMHCFRYSSDLQEWGEVAGVNVTLGLPIIRTSVAHGTAFDLVGTGKASERSLLDAIEIARLLAERQGRDK